jgi:intracellular multiplication protein IcmN
MVISTMNLQIKKIVGLCIIGTGVVLAGCSKPPAKPVINKWVYSKSVSQKQERAHELAVLRAQGIQIFIQGESVKLVLPNEDVFATDSANLRDEARTLLNHVSKLIKTYTVVRINVDAYSDSQAWPGAPVDQKLALTNAAAQTVASYLWQSGIDTRFIAAKGYSSKNSVAWNGTPNGRNFNRRVEISFRFYPHFVTYN